MRLVLQADHRPPVHEVNKKKRACVWDPIEAFREPVNGPSSRSSL